jgi:hypothetical protein
LTSPKDDIIKANMVRTQIQLPDRLHRRLKTIARNRESSLAELIRIGMEDFAATCVDTPSDGGVWELPVLDPSGGLKEDPVHVKAEAEAIEARTR